MQFNKAVEGFNITFLANGGSPHTVKGYSWVFKKFSDFLNNPEVEEITSTDCKRFFLHVQTETDLSSSSILKLWIGLKSFFNWAKEDLDIPSPLTIPMPQSATKEVNPFSMEEIKKLLDVCESNLTGISPKGKKYTLKRRTGIRDRAIILILLDTGLRVSEFARLKYKDVNIETGEVLVRPYLKGRKSRSRVVYISTKTKKALWRYLATRDEIRDEDYLFLTRDSKLMNKQSVEGILRFISDKAGLKQVHPHRFRHTMAIQFLSGSLAR